MPLELSFDIGKGLSDTAKQLGNLASEETRSEINELLAREQVTRLKEYHAAFDAEGGWANPSGPTHGPGRKRTGFGQNVTRAWNTRDHDSGGFTIANDAPWLKHKVEGGTIKATGKALTIPMDPRAHGVRARDFPGKLFIPKGKDYLAESKDGEFHVVYLLRKTVTQKPWPGALPDLDDEATFMTRRFAELIIEKV